MSTDISNPPISRCINGHHYIDHSDRPCPQCTAALEISRLNYELARAYAHIAKVAMDSLAPSSE